MILIKNTASQIAYSKAIDVLTGEPISGISSVDITVYITKDDSAEASASNSVSEVGHGIYKITLTQSETNCNTGVINFVHTSNSQYQFETLYFQTTESNPSVNVTQNNDKTGYFLDNAQTFTTTGAVGSVTDAQTILNTLQSATYDGITQTKILEMLLSFMAGKIVITTVDANNRLISYKKRDGATEKFSVIVSTADGSRSTGGTIS